MWPEKQKTEENKNKTEAGGLLLAAGPRKIMDLWPVDGLA
jgi:hypothetical protein